MDPTHRLIVAPYSESSPSLLSHAAGAGQRRAAQDLGLPVDEQGCVYYPDAQLEYTDENGRTTRVNVEVASGHYSSRYRRSSAAPYLSRIAPRR